MTASPLQDGDRTALMQAVTQIGAYLERAAGQTSSVDPSLPFVIPSTLERLCQIFGLSDFESNLLLLCVGMELDHRFAALCAGIHQDEHKNYPTFGLALALFENSHWSALMPSSALRSWRLIEVGAGAILTLSPLRIDERILHYLIGHQHLDERLANSVEAISDPRQLVKSHARLAQQIADAWGQAAPNTRLPAIQLCGEDSASKLAIAQGACQLVGLNLHSIKAAQIPTNSSDRALFLRLWERESVLANSGLLIDCDDTDINRHSEVVVWLLERMTSPPVILTNDPLRSHKRTLLNFDVGKPTSVEQYHHWEQNLGFYADSLNGHVKGLVAQFRLSAPVIETVCATTLNQVEPATDEGAIAAALWDACRVQARPRMEDLAQRIEVSATWEDLVLPEAAMETLRTMAAHLRQRAKVYESWGFSRKSRRGLGISALFAGPSGTGKTTAAEVLAKELHLDLYKIDLSSVVSKYIGETEKNLRRVFDAAESGGAILLFDEADALFGKRSDVKDSHDRHANIEVSYLLQRMEAYQGLAILTTNMKGALDTAFLRRIRFTIQFAFPDVKQRAEIWRRVFPKETPTEDLAIEKLAKLSIAGGNIRNIALNAAFLAADADEPVRMKHLLSAARSEYMKLEKPLMDSEIKGWVSG